MTLVDTSTANHDPRIPAHSEPQTYPGLLDAMKPGPALPGYQTSATIAQLFAAKAKARASFAPIMRTREVQVRTKDGRSYSFKYAPLDTVLDACMPALAAQGLDMMWLMAPKDNGGVVLTCVLSHASGEFVCMDTYLPPADGPQARGSQITYGRRYQAQCLLGVASEEDDDGNAAEGNAADIKERTPQPRGKATPTPATRKQEPEAKREGVERVAESLRAKGHTVTIVEQPAPEPEGTAKDDAELESQLRASVNAGNGRPEPELEQEPELTGPITEGQKLAIRALAIKLKMSGPVIGERCKKVTGKTAMELSAKDAAKLIDDLQGNA